MSIYHRQGVIVYFGKPFCAFYIIYRNGTRERYRRKSEYDRYSYKSLHTNLGSLISLIGWYKYLTENLIETLIICIKP